MTNDREAFARTIIGVIGNVTSFFLFISPAPTLYRVWKKKSTEEFHPYPYLAGVMNCVFWVFYGIPLVHPDSTLVITINGIGLVLELIYLIIFAIYTTKRNRGIIALVLLIEAVLFAGIALVTLLCFHTHALRSMFVGIICVVFGIVLYSSPLSIMRKVFLTKSVEFLPFWLCLAGFVNGAVWFAYSFLKIFDPYICTGNGIGGLLGLVQLCVYAYYSLKGPPPKKADGVKPYYSLKGPPPKKADGVKPSEVQLHTTNASSLPV